MHYSVEKIVSLLHKQKMRRVKKEKWKISNGDFHLVNFAVWILYYEMETRIRLKHFHFCRIFKQRFIARGRGAKRPKADEPTDARTQRAVTPPRWQRRCVKASVTGVSDDKNRGTRVSRNESVSQECQGTRQCHKRANRRRQCHKMTQRPSSTQSPAQRRIEPLEGGAQRRPGVTGIRCQPSASRRPRKCPLVPRRARAGEAAHTPRACKPTRNERPVTFFSKLATVTYFETNLLVDSIVIFPNLFALNDIPNWFNFNKLAWKKYGAHIKAREF